MTACVRVCVACARAGVSVCSADQAAYLLPSHMAIRRSTAPRVTTFFCAALLTYVCVDTLSLALACKRNKNKSPL